MGAGGRYHWQWSHEDGIKMTFGRPFECLSIGTVLVRGDKMVKKGPPSSIKSRYERCWRFWRGKTSCVNNPPLQPSPALLRVGRSKINQIHQDQSPSTIPQWPKSQIMPIISLFIINRRFSFIWFLIKSIQCNNIDNINAIPSFTWHTP